MKILNIVYHYITWMCVVFVMFLFAFVPMGSSVWSIFVAVVIGTVVFAIFEFLEYLL